MLILPQKSIVGPLTHKAPFMKDQYFVGVFHGGEAVGDDDGRFALRNLTDAFSDKALIFCIQTRRRFIKDEDGWVFDEGSSNANPLSLAT